MPKRENVVNATRHSLEIIDVIRSAHGSRLTDIARELDLSKSAVHKHLNTLRAEGYVTKEGEFYHVGLRFFNLGQHARHRNARFGLAEEKTAKLAQRLNHAVDFDMETNGRIMTLFHRADESAEIGFREGDYFHIHTSATGKAISAALSEESVRDIIEQWGLPQETPRTITSADALFEELETTRDRGYATVDEEWLNGHRAVGVAVTFPDGRPFGALSAGGPTYQLTPERIEVDVAPTLIDAADELGEAIGEVFP